MRALLLFLFVTIACCAKAQVIVTLGGCFPGPHTSPAMAKAQTGLVLSEKSERSQNWKIMSFKMYYKNGTDYVSEETNGAMLSPKMLTLLKQSVSKSIILFDEIKIVDTTGVIRKLPPISYAM